MCTSKNVVILEQHTHNLRHIQINISDAARCGTFVLVSDSLVS